MRPTFMILIQILTTIWLSIFSVISATNNFINENEIKKKIKNITIQKNINELEKEQIIKKLKLALHAISENQYSKNKIKEYQNIIDNFSSIMYQLHKEKSNNIHLKNNNNQNILISSNELQQYQLKIHQELRKIDQKIQKEQDLELLINNSLLSLPQQHTEIKKELYNINKKISQFTTKKEISYLQKAELIALQAQKEAKKNKIRELEFAQLSANNRQQISRSHLALLKQKYEQLDKKSQFLHVQLHNIRQKEAEETIKNIQITQTKKNQTLPECIIKQLQTNHNLSQSLNKQIHNINLITLQQRKITSHIIHVRQSLSKLLKQAKWINKSPALGEILRSQISKLPKINIYKPQQLNNEITQLRVERFQYEEQINKLCHTSLQNKIITKTLTNNQKKILKIQINIQKKLLNSLLTNCDIQITELTKLKISHEELKNIFKEIEKYTQIHLLWIPDIHPIDLSYPSKIYENFYLLFNKNKMFQFKNIIKTIINKNIKILIVFTLFLLLICYANTIYHHYYYSFLLKSKKQLKYQKNTNYFSLTLKNIFLSNVIALPIPILWGTVGYILFRTWEYPILSSIGKGMISSTPILWLLITITYFASKNGLFIINFQWEKTVIRKAFYNYTLYIILITCLLTMLIVLNNYDHKKFYDTLGRFLFIILCICLTFITYNTKQSNIPLYIDKNKSHNNIINNILWNVFTIFPIINAIIACFGYLAISQIILTYLEISIIILFISSIIYYTLQCWTITQKNRIILEYKKNNKKIIITQNKNQKPLLSIFQISNIIHQKKHNTEKNIHHSKINLDTISDQSLQFIRSVLVFITYTIIFFLWSEFHSIFEFLEKITIWDTKSTLQNTHNIEPITLKTLLTTILILFLTRTITKNLPSLLELTILQHLHFRPETNYTILSITKYTLMILGIIIGCSYIGFEWSKLQWLVAAIGVGLGFGLQEIFANFISGLIILFEKPIRIGDTITISDLTGKITQINIRATTIKDRNHKEIIIPNKEFITKKFINWSLSDTITRVVINVPAPSEANIAQVTQILLKAAKSCPLVLTTPQPEVYLVNIENGTPLFEIRMHTAKTSHRMPLRHQVHILIIHFYKKYGLHLPFPHLNIHNKKNNNI